MSAHHHKLCTSTSLPNFFTASLPHLLTHSLRLISVVECPSKDEAATTVTVTSTAGGVFAPSQ